MDPASTKITSCTPPQQQAPPRESSTLASTTTPLTKTKTATATATAPSPNTSAQRYLRFRSQSLSSTIQHEFTDSAAILQTANGESFVPNAKQTSSPSSSKCLSLQRLSSPFRKTGNNMARLLRRASQSFRSTPLDVSTLATPSPQSTPDTTTSTTSSSFATKDVAQNHQPWLGYENSSGSEQDFTPTTSSPSSEGEERSERRGLGGRLKVKLGKRRASMSQHMPASSSEEEDVMSDGESGFFQYEDEIMEKPEVKKDFTVILPPEVATHVFSFLDTQSLLGGCSLVSKRWNRLVDDPYVWQHLFQNQYGPWKYKPGNDWKKMTCAYKEINGRWGTSRTIDPAVSYFSGHKDNVYCVQFDEQKVLTGSRDNTIRVWDIKTQECLRILGACNVDRLHPEYPLYQKKDPHHVGCHQMSVLCLQFDAEILVTGSSDTTCVVWSLPDYIPIKRLTHHSGGVLDVAFDKDYIVTCSKDTTIAVWDRKTLTLVHKFVGHTGPVNAIAIKNDFIISASGDATVKMWSISQKKLIKTFIGHERGLACVQISDDASTIVSGGNDKMIRIWDVKSGKCIRELDGHRNLVRTLQLDCKHRRIISGSYDMTVRVWNMDTGRTILSIKRYHSTSVLAAKADFRRLISASQDNKVVMHDFAAGVDGAELLD